MTTFVEDINGRRWRRDLFICFDRHEDGPVTAYRQDSSGDLHPVEFHGYEWCCPEDSGFIEFSATPGHFAILDAEDDQGRWSPRLLAVIGWVQQFVGLCPVTMYHVTARNPTPILFPDGHVEDWEGSVSYQDLDRFTEARRATLQ